MFEKYLLNIFALSWPAKMLAVFVAFIAPLASVIHVIIALLIVDAGTSIYYQMREAAKNKPGKRDKLRASVLVIESGRLRKTLEKMFFYVLMIIVFYAFDIYVIKVRPISADEIHTFSITNIAAVLIALVELTSIASNVSKITGNPIFNKVVSLFKKKVEDKYEIREEQ